MSIQFQNSQFRDFFDHNILELLLQEPNEETYLELDSAIETAATLFSNDAVDLKKLEAMRAALWSRVSRPSLNLQELSELAPVGIPRPVGIMNCGFNAVLQLLANAPNFGKKVLERKNSSCVKIASLLTKYFEAQIGPDSVAFQVDSQEFRTSTSSASSNARELEDVFEILIELFEKTGSKYVFDLEVGGFASTTKPEETLLPLNMAIGERGFRELLNDFFVTSIGNGRKKVLRFQEVPQDLVIQAQRFNDAGIISDDLEQVPHQFQMDQAFLTQKQEAYYQITGCIILQEDHYVTLVKKPAGWYLINDEIVEKIATADANHLLKKGYIFHYARLEKEVMPNPCRDWTLWAAKIVDTVLKGSLLFFTPSQSKKTD